MIREPPLNVPFARTLLKKSTSSTIKINQKHTKEYIPSAGSGLGCGSEGAAGEKNMHDAEFTCALFRFIQLTCEGHNLGETFEFNKNKSFFSPLQRANINFRMAKLFKNSSR